MGCCQGRGMSWCLSAMAAAAAVLCCCSCMRLEQSFTTPQGPHPRPPSLPHLPPRTAPIPVAAPAGDDGRSWQPYADHLVYTALVALPWGGPELAESVPEAVAGLLAAAEAYMGKRPRSTQPSLRPYSASVREDDPVAE